MTTTTHCAQCHAPLSEDTPEGLCPVCLLREACDPTCEPGAEPAAASAQRYPPPKPHELAEHFPQLEILDLTGHGGMGAVYKARQTALDRLVALKIIRPETADDPTFAERFAREAKALARLNHPNIVGVYDFGRTGGMYYLIMEFVDGTDLRQMLATSQLQPEEALAIVPQICEALEYAHGEGVVHRDIKPENVLVDRNGRVKIADFGLVKLINRAAADFQLTDTQQVMGTPNYMSPEQMERPLEVDHRADIYSLGVVLYEMLTGELPLGRFEPPSKKVQIDVRLDEVVLRSLEKKPERRYQHASDFKSEVEAIRASDSPLSAAGAFRAADLGGLAVVIIVFALVGMGIVLAESALPMWGLVVLWWFVDGFKWSTLGKTTAGLLGVFLALFAIGGAIWVTGELMPLWALLGVFWFASDFGWTESDELEAEEEEFLQEDGDYKGPVIGLNRRDRQILRRLQKFDPKSDGTFFVLPSIPKGRLANSRRACEVPPTERILAIFDFTAWGTANRALLIGSSGVFYFCSEETNPDGPARIEYKEFPKLAIVNGGDHVILDQKRTLTTGWSSVSCEKLTNVLIALRETVEA